MSERIEHSKPAELIPYPRNPRRHSDAQIAQIAGSIAQFGFNAPIPTDSRSNIIAGHGRYLASPTRYPWPRPIASPKSRSAPIRSPDNKLADLSGWDDETLASELAELRDAAIGLGGPGFSGDELAVLLAEAESLLPDLRRLPRPRRRYIDISTVVARRPSHPHRPMPCCASGKLLTWRSRVWPRRPAWAWAPRSPDRPR